MSTPATNHPTLRVAISTENFDPDKTIWVPELDNHGEDTPDTAAIKYLAGQARRAASRMYTKGAVGETTSVHSTETNGAGFNHVKFVKPADGCGKEPVHLHGISGMEMAVITLNPDECIPPHLHKSIEKIYQWMGPAPVQVWIYDESSGLFLMYQLDDKHTCLGIPSNAWHFVMNPGTANLKARFAVIKSCPYLLDIKWYPGTDQVLRNTHLSPPASGE